MILITGTGFLFSRRHPVHSKPFDIRYSSRPSQLTALRTRSVSGTAVGKARKEGSRFMSTQRAKASTEQRLTRRGAVRAGGVSAAAMLASAAMQRASAKD